MPVPESVIEDHLSVKYRSKYISLWNACLAEGFSTAEARLYSRCEIVRMVRAGELPEVPNSRIIDLIKDPEPNAETRFTLINPPHAPVKLRPRVVKKVLPFCKGAPVATKMYPQDYS